MRPPDPNDPDLAAFLHSASERLAASLLAHGVDIPPAAIDQFARLAAEHLVANPHDKTFYNISGSRLSATVRELEAELPGGRTNPRFNDVLAIRFRELLKGQGDGPTDPAASA